MLNRYLKDSVFLCVLCCAYTDDLIYAVNGESLYRSTPLKGFVISYSTKRILDTFSPNKKVNNTSFNTVVSLNWPKTALNVDCLSMITLMTTLNRSLKQVLGSSTDYFVGRPKPWCHLCHQQVKKQTLPILFCSNYYELIFKNVKSCKFILHGES